ncbi:PilZ domain-containing protein [Breoghania sp.]|uniref:PilZ domain-containing protein n=1 Tax=Breoghania sp. TaxID=2065378 RepID=UPI002AA76586|nr:PilZ domain-containing protein [Breoghania sp.]
MDQRRFQRVKVSLLGRFMLENRREYPCQVINMSPGGAAVVAPVTAGVGERVIAYIDHIGRIEGKVVRMIDGGFAMTINATARKRDKLANQLTWLANRHELDLPEDRRHERFAPEEAVSRIELADGREYSCRVIDVSLSGAALATTVKPAIGTPIILGKMRARVVRHSEEGIAVEFAAVQDIEEVRKQIS